MIAVIADDFTGAAEIGGVGLRHGLKVVIETEAIQHYNTDLLVIATDTRSLSAKDAAICMSEITKKLMVLKPEFIYKKVDSVLRGNISEELTAQMKVTGKTRSVVIAANPAFNRIIRDGIYYINETPLGSTNFANDPEYPVNSSIVKDIIGDTSICSIKPDAELPQSGIIIGDTINCEDLNQWASKIDNNTLAAGASGFFDVLLNKWAMINNNNSITTKDFGEKALYVLGSTFPKDYDLLRKLEQNGHYLSNMPGEIYTNKNFDPKFLEAWADDIVKGICENKKAIASIFHTPGNEPDISSRIRDNIGKLIKKVLEKTTLNELIIEGGSTTYSILKHLNVKKLYPIQEIDTGVIRMEMDGIPDLYLTTKPGSYIWPQNFWFFNNRQSIKSIIH